MFADDFLLEKFVLKGGSAIDLAYKIDARSSIDIDLSLEEDFSDAEFKEISIRIKRSLDSIFDEAGYIVFDYIFSIRPRQIKKDRPHFWGGYRVEFKIISKEREEYLKTDIDKARRNAEDVGPGHIKKFEIDISKYEYCKEKTTQDIDGYTIYVYTPKMLVIEKLRALCQQMSEYKYNVGTKAPRVRDLYDIFVLVKRLNIIFSTEDLELLEKVFEIKEVPVDLLKMLPKYKEQYEDMQSLKDTVPNSNLEPFEVYFNFVLDLINSILEKDIQEKVN